MDREVYAESVDIKAKPENAVVEEKPDRKVKEV